jgi:hypothetical protein
MKLRGRCFIVNVLYSVGMEIEKKLVLPSQRLVLTEICNQIGISLIKIT